MKTSFRYAREKDRVKREGEKERAREWEKDRKRDGEREVKGRGIERVKGRGIIYREIEWKV